MSKDIKWHTLKIQEVLKKLNVNESGITDYEAKIRKDRYGENLLEEHKRKTLFDFFLEQFKSILVLILIIAVIISAFLGEFLDSGVILIIIILNAMLGAIQERKAETALEALRKISISKTMVLRNGVFSIIPSPELVPGDIVLLKAGDAVAADMRIIDQLNLRADESLLTGESVPVSKNIAVLKDCPVSERKNMLFSGTTVVYGKCKAVVVSTGMATELGAIAAELKQPEEKTPLQKTLDKLGTSIGFAFIAVSVLVFFIGWFSGVEISAIFLLAIALAVAAVPEGLPAAVTIGLGLGVERIAARNAIMRRLSSVETLGCVTVICSDKTGTLTMNQMTVKHLYIDDRVINITGQGYDTIGRFIENGKEISPKKHNDIHLLLAAGIMCNDADIDRKTGDPTELALLVSAKKAGIEDMRKQYIRVDEIAFDSDRKIMSVAYDIGKKRMIYTKGAIENVLRKCSHIYTAGRVRKITITDVRQIAAANNKLAKSGMRVLGFATRKSKTSLKISESNLIFIGLQAMADPPRPEAKESIEVCKNSGIRIVMITGDHKETAIFVANQLGINIQQAGHDTNNFAAPSHDTNTYPVSQDSHNIQQAGHGNTYPVSQDSHNIQQAGHGNTYPASQDSHNIQQAGHGNTYPASQNSHNIETQTIQDIITGAELDKLTDDELDKIVDNISIYARATPFHKVRITECLKRRGHVVAMTGDGINDAPALKKADIGIALGTGTEVAKEASDMVLADDNFTSIVSAVKEGRAVYNNIRKTLAYLLSGNISEVLVIFLAVVIGSALKLPLPIPLLAVQLLWINLVTDGIPALALAADSVDDAVMKKQPRQMNESIFKGMKKYIIGFPIIMTICVLGLFIWSLSIDPANITRAQTLVFTGIVVFEIFAALSVRNPDSPIGKKIFKNDKLMAAIFVSIVLQFIIIYSPLANQIFYTAPLMLLDWLIIAGLALIGFIYLEGSKYFENKQESAISNYSRSHNKLEHL